VVPWCDMIEAADTGAAGMGCRGRLGGMGSEMCAGVAHQARWGAELRRARARELRLNGRHIRSRMGVRRESCIGHGHECRAGAASSQTPRSDVGALAESI
jgi:hypothetical protein